MAFLKSNLLFLLFFLSLGSLMAQNERELRNLEAFSRLYGHVRYFCPSDASAEIDWDRMALLGIAAVKDCKNDRQLMDSLRSLFSPITPFFSLSAKAKKLNMVSPLSDSVGSGLPVFWQHQGLGLEKKGYDYKSLRAGRPMVTRPFRTNTMAWFGKRVNVSEYRGLPFRASAKLKKEEGEAIVRLWTRQFNPHHYGGSVKYKEVLHRNWETVIIEGTIDNDADWLRANILMAGFGMVGADDLSIEVSIDGEWKTLVYEEFEGETSFENQPGYELNVINDHGQNYLRLKSVELSREAEYDYTQKILPGIYPAADSLTKVEIVKGLFAVYPQALWDGGGREFNQSQQAALEKLNRKLQNIEDPVQLPNSELNTRLSAVCILWNTMQHFYPYMELSGASLQWDRELRLAFERAFRSVTTADFQRTLQLMMAKLKDGHAWVKSPYIEEEHQLPIEWRFLNGKLVVTTVYEEVKGVERGDIITSIDGIPIDIYLDRVRPIVQASSPSAMDRNLPALIRSGKQGSTLQLTFEGKSDPVVLSRDKELYRPVKTKPVIYWLDENKKLLFIDYTRLTNDILAKSDSLLMAASTIICDLRGYPSHWDTFIRMMLSAPDTTKGFIKVPVRSFPDNHKVTYDTKEWGFTPFVKHIDAKVIFLTDGTAMSQAESQLSIIKHYKLATIIGEPTAGINGGTITFYLPGGWHIRFTGLVFTLPNGDRHFGVGIQPDIFVSPTLKGIKEGRDELLEEAIKK